MSNERLTGWRKQVHTRRKRKTTQAKVTYKHRRRTLPAIGLMAFFLASLSGGALSLVTGAAAAEKVKWTGVATGRGGGHWQVWEWIEKRIPEITNGEVEVEVTTYGEIGIGGTEMIRILKAGLVDIVDVNGGYVAGDWPVIEGTELHGVTKSPEELEAVYDAFLRNVVAPREDIMGGKVLASYYWNNTFCFSKISREQLGRHQGQEAARQFGEPWRNTSGRSAANRSRFRGSRYTTPCRRA